MGKRTSRGIRRLLRLLAAGLIVLVLPFALVAALMIVGFSQHHRSIPFRLLSPDRAFEVRLQNDVRGSIQPTDWRLLLKRSDVVSDDPEKSCEVARVGGEDGWRSVVVEWRSDGLWLGSAPSRSIYTLEKQVELSPQHCAAVPVHLIGAVASVRPERAAATARLIRGSAL